MPKGGTGGKKQGTLRVGNSSANPNRVLTGKSRTKKDGGHMRDKSTINRLNMYKGGKLIRNRKGRIVGGELQSRDRTGDKPMGAVARVA